MQYTVIIKTINSLFKKCFQALPQVWNEYNFKVKGVFTFICASNLIASLVLKCIAEIFQNVGIIEWSHINQHFPEFEKNLQMS